MSEFGQNVADLPVLWQLQVSHYVEKVRWALDYKRVPHVRRSMLPGAHIGQTKRLTGDTSTAPVSTLDGRSIGDSTRIIAAIEQRWPQPPLYPDDPAQRRRALELEAFFDEELGPQIRRAFYHELLPHPELLVPLFTHGDPVAAQTLREVLPLLCAEFPYPMVSDDGLSESWRTFHDSLARRPAGRWVADIYREHRGRSAEVPGDALTPTMR